MKKFESAVVWTTFIDKSLPKTLKKIARFIKENNPSTIDDNFEIHCEYSDGGKWYSSFGSHYQNDKKIVEMIKDEG